MKVLAFILLFEVFSCIYAIKCHFCVGEEDCNGSPPVQDCNKDLVTGIDEEAHACQIEWKVDEDGGYDIIGRSCAYGRGGSKESRGYHDCNLNGDGSGSCYCNSDNCNAQASILQNDASRIKCWHCIGSECREDQNNYGSEITCPIGVTRCMVKGNRWSDKFHRSCEWEFKDPSMDQIGLDGYCAVTENAENMHICTCSTEKCNTGFHGPKCHIYKTSNCGSHGSIMGLDESTGPSVMPCLTGTKYCADITVDYHGICHESYYTCGIGVTSLTEDELDQCHSKNVENVLPNATVCYCDAANLEMCDPSGSNQLHLSILALITSLAIIIGF